jgi:hypothetical protein
LSPAETAKSLELMLIGVLSAMSTTMFMRRWP